MKKRIKKVLPQALTLKVRFLIVLFREIIPAYYYDFSRYSKFGGVIEFKTYEQLIGIIIKEYHVIEKGLTMPETRLGFGKEKVKDLILHCMNFIDRYGKSDEQLRHAIEVICEYREYHRQRNFELDEYLLDGIASLLKQFNSVIPTKQRSVSKEEYFSHIDNNFPLFSLSRSSVRNYTSEPVSLPCIINAVELARSSPSACNRQTSRVYIYTEQCQIQEILALQGGNRGFGHLVNKLIIVTAELGMFYGAPERNQAFIDGGIFAMNLLYSLHFNQIGACILNCSFSPEREKRIRKVSKIRDTESFISMISCGNLPDKFDIALSKRYSVHEIIRVK